MICLWMLNHLFSCCLALQVSLDRVRQKQTIRSPFYRAMFVMLMGYQALFFGMIMSSFLDALRIFMPYMWGLLGMIGFTLIARLPAGYPIKVRIRLSLGLLAMSFLIMVLAIRELQYASLAGLLLILYVGTEYGVLHQKREGVFIHARKV